MVVLSLACAEESDSRTTKLNLPSLRVHHVMPMWYNDNPKIIENQLLDAMGGSAAKSAASTSIPLQGDVSSELCPPCEDESVGTLSQRLGIWKGPACSSQIRPSTTTRSCLTCLPSR